MTLPRGKCHFFNFFIMKRFLVSLSLCSLLFYNFPVKTIPRAIAASPGSVVVNELAWMGSADSSSDEWIELYNTTANDIDLAGWTIEDDGSTTYAITSGVIAAHSYFLIEDAQEATSVEADIVIPMSLGNTGDSLVLMDETQTVIDTVNESAGPWYAGDNTTKATMERKDPGTSSEEPTNWDNATTGNGATGQSGSTIMGTPKSQNSVYTGSAQEAGILIADIAAPLEGETFTLSINATDVNDITAYGFDILYDATMLQYVDVEEGSFLHENQTVPTSFHYGLENNTPGKIVIGNTRLDVPQTGVSGSGTLCTLTFEAVQAGTTTVLFDSPSFVKDTAGDVPLSLDAYTLTIDPQSIDPVENLVITEGANRYELALSWTPPSTGADSYLVMRKNESGILEEIAQTTQTTIVDSDNLIPHIMYEYHVIALQGTLQSTPIVGQAADTRGLTGDNNRSDRVDGRDLDNLAQHYTLTHNDTAFDPLIDTTYDGLIDGNDLIDIGANWALTY